MTLLVTHQFSTIRDANRILVLNRGQLIKVESLKVAQHGSPHRGDRCRRRGGGQGIDP
jgi:ABC-type transport system involved in cytochrome bd biosynthesis fused ATPase/permease subunit